MSQANTTTTPDNLGARFRRLREGAGLGVREMSRRTGLSAPFISQVESNKRRAGVQTALKILREVHPTQEEAVAVLSSILARPDAERDLLVQLLQSRPHHQAVEKGYSYAEAVMASTVPNSSASSSMASADVLEQWIQACFDVRERSE